MLDNLLYALAQASLSRLIGWRTPDERVQQPDGSTLVYHGDWPQHDSTFDWLTHGNDYALRVHAPNRVPVTFSTNAQRINQGPTPGMVLECQPGALTGDFHAILIRQIEQQANPQAEGYAPGDNQPLGDSSSSFNQEHANQGARVLKEINDLIAQIRP